MVSNPAPRRVPVLAAIVATVMVVLLVYRSPATTAGNSYTQTNLLSDNGVPGTKRDTRLLNAWGMAFFNGGPFWINDEASGVSELIDGRGNIFSSQPFVNIPAPGGAGPSRPTGMVINATSEFAIPGGPALFIFDSLDGTITAWNIGPSAVTMVDNSTTAKYTGLATAMIGSTTFLYAANAAGRVDVFDGSFKPFKTTGSFSDSSIPAGLTPYGIANIDGNLYVTYAQTFGGSGAVDEYTPEGVMVRRFATGGTLVQPWAVAMAPASFGAFSNDLLIGNFGNGTISAFNPTTSAFLGQLDDSKGNPIKIDGLWSLVVGGGAMGVTNPNAMYFTAGPNGQADGLFGFLAANGPAATATSTKAPTSTPKPTPSPSPHRTTTPKPTATPKPIAPVITSIPSTILIGANFVINGKGFTAGSEVNFFVATANGAVNAGPLVPIGKTSTQLNVAVPTRITPGEGFVTVEVINTDTGFLNSNLASALLMGAPGAGFPDLTKINGVGLAATSSSPAFASNNVQTVVPQGSVVRLGGAGFDTTYGVAVNLFCACAGGKVGPFILNPGDPGLRPMQISFMLPAKGMRNSPPTGPGSFVVINAGISRTFADASNAVSVPIGAKIAVTSVTQSGKIVTINGDGFSTLTIINMFNSQGGGAVNLGGLNAKGAPNIPLKFVSENKLTFTVPLGAKPGPSYVQALNPPFVPFTSSGNAAGGAFTLTAGGATPTPTPRPTPTKDSPAPTPTPYFFGY